MPIPIDDGQPWWKVRPVENQGQRKLRSAIQKRADAILSREGARFPDGTFNPRVISREEARVISQAYPKVAEQQGRPGQALSGFEALGTILDPAIKGFEAIAETGMAATQVGTGGELPITGLPSVLNLPLTVGGKEKALERSRQSLGEIGQAIRGRRDFTETVGGLAARQRERPFVEQLGAGAVFDPLNLLPGVGFGPDIIRGLKLLKGAGREALEDAIRNAPRTAEGIRAALNSVGDRFPGVKRILQDETGAIRLEGTLRGQRIRRFLDPQLDARLKATNKAVEDAGMKMDALAGTREDEFFVAIEVPKNVRGIPYRLGAEPIPGLAPDIRTKITNRGLSGKRLFFKSFDDVDAFLKTGEYKAPSITSPLRKGPIKPLYVTEKVGPPTAEAKTPVARFFDDALEERKEAMLRQVGIDPESVKVSTSAGFGRTAKTFTSIPAFTDLPQDTQAKLARLAFGGTTDVVAPPAAIPRVQRVRRAQVAGVAGTPAPPTKPVPVAPKRVAQPRQRVVPSRQSPGGVVAKGAWESGAERPFAFDPNSTQNQGRFRLLPAKPQGKYITRQSGTPGVTYIVDTEANAIQAVRFNKAQFPEAKAAEWWEANKGRFKFSNQAAEEAVSVPRSRTLRTRRTPPPLTEPTAGFVPPSPAAAPPVSLRRLPLAARQAGGARATPLEPRRVSQRQPSVEAGAGPPGGRLPSGRDVGGPGRAQPPPPRDPYGMLKASLEPEREPLISRVRTSLPQELYDRNYPLKALEEATGIPARKLAQRVPGAIGAGEDTLHRFYKPIVDRLKDSDLKFLERYMVLMRDSDILARNPHARLPGGIANEGERQIALAALQREVGSARFARLEQAATDLWRANDEQVLRPWLDEGIIDAQMYREMKSAHPHYIPFMRDDFAEVITNSFSARPEANLSTTGIRKMGLEGSERALSNPLLRLLQQPIKAKQTIFRNRAAKSIVRALEEQQRLTGEELVRYIDPKKEMNVVQRVTGETIPRLKKGEISQQWETISFFENGVKNRVEVPSIYGRVAKGLEAEPDNILLKAARFLNAPLRLGATSYNPFFLPVNVVRDAMSAMFREKVFPFGPDYIAGLWGAIRKNADFSEAAQSGALLGGVVENMRPTRALRNPLGGITVKNPWEAVTLIPRLIEEANIIAERGVRIATFRKLRAEGLDQLEAAVRSRDATVDFAKSGHSMRVINQVVPFTNAAVQGSANIARTIRDHPARSAAFATMFAGVAIAERVNNMRFETSDLIPDYEYTRSWVVQFGEGTRADGTKYPIYLKIPKGEIAALFTFPAEAMFHLARKSEDRSAVELLLSSVRETGRVVSPIDVFGGGITDVLPPVAETAVGLQTGVDPFTGFAIVPERLRGLPPEQQFTKETSQTAIQIGRLFKVSPLLVDFALSDVAAGGGQTLNWMASMGLEALGVDVEAFGSGDPDADLPLTGLEKLTKERTPGLSRFIGTRDTQLVRRGYDNLSDAVVDTNRAIGNFPDVRRLGIKFGQVQGTIEDTELTPAQRARYQELAGQLAIEGLTKLQSGSRYGLRSDVEQEAAIREVFDNAREEARDIVLREIREGVQPQPTPSGTGSSTWERMKQPTSTGSSGSSTWDRMRQATPVGAP